MKQTTSLYKAVLLALGLGVTAAATAATFDYDYVEGGFGEIDNDGEVLFIDAARDINRNWGVVGGLYVGDADPNVDVSALEIGMQYHQPLKSNAAFQAGLKILHVDVDAGRFGDDDDTGFIANVGARFQLQPRLQLEGDIKLSSNDLIDDGLGLQGAVRYYLDRRLSIAGGLAVDTELDGLFVNVRYDL